MLPACGANSALCSVSRVALVAAAVAAAASAAFCLFQDIVLTTYVIWERESSGDDRSFLKRYYFRMNADCKLNETDPRPFGKMLYVRSRVLLVSNICFVSVVVSKP